MATERLSMRKTREILRQKWELCRTHREIAASVQQSLGAVALTLGRKRLMRRGSGLGSLPLLPSHGGILRVEHQQEGHDRSRPPARGEDVVTPGRLAVFVDPQVSNPGGGGLAWRLAGGIAR